MSKLNWKERSSVNSEWEASYKGLRIRAVRDDNPSNPFEDEDGHWPMITLYGAEVQTYDAKSITGRPIDRFTNEQIIHDQKAIAKILDVDPNEYMELDEPPRKWFTDADLLRYAFEEAFDQLERRAMLDTLEELYDLAGIPCYRADSRGYCQGDIVNLLVVAPPEAVKEIHPDVTPEELQRDMENQVRLFTAWAWGDVYGYIVEGPEDADGEREQLSSCWGFYGDEFAKSGLEEEAVRMADYHVEKARMARQFTLRQLIHNRVPIDRRAALLARAEERAYA